MFRGTRLSKFWYLALASIALVALVAAACGDDDDDDDDGAGGGENTVTISAGDTIKIGISSILSGDLEALGVPIAQAAELASVGVTIEGFEIEWVRKDDSCSPEGGQSAASQLLEAGVVAVVGPVCSGSVIAAQDQYEAAGVTHVSPSSTAIKSTSPDRGTPYSTFFRVTYNDAIQGPAQADFAIDTLEVNTVFIVHDTDAYGTGLQDAFAEAFVDRGGEIVGSAQGYEKGATDFQSIIASIQAEDPDLVYFAGFFSEGTPFLQQLRGVNADVLFLSGDGVRSAEFISGAGADAEGAYLSLPSPVLEGGVFDDFAAKFEAEVGAAAIDSPFTAEAFDAATVIINALIEVAEKDGDDLVIDLDKLNKAIADTDFTGVIGRIKFDDKGDNAGGETPVTLWIVTNGEFVALD